MRKFAPLMMIVATGCHWVFDDASTLVTDTGLVPDTDTGTSVETDTDIDADPDTGTIATTGDTGSAVHSGSTGDTAGLEDTGAVTHSGSTASTADTGLVIDTDTGVPVETADTAEPCVPVNWYYDGDRDGATGFDLVESSCPDPGAGWTQSPPSDCDDSSPTVHPGAVEIANDGVDQDCVGGDLVVVIDDTGHTGLIVDTDTDTDTGIVGPPDCSAGESRFSGSYTAPVGATSATVKIEIYDANGVQVRPMVAIVDGVDGWTVDSSVPGTVTFENVDCHPDNQTIYASALHNAFPGYDCSGTANPSYTAYGAWAFAFDEVAAGVAYVNNFEVNGQFPFGHGNGCEAKAIR